MTEPIAAFQVPPVEKSVLLPCAPARAFEAFTAEIAQWWPLATHSIGQEKARGVQIEPRVGGRVYETGADGAEHEWGRVLEWSPPHRLTMTWHPGRMAETHQLLELTFTAEGAGTRLSLVHRGWERLGAKAQATRDNYQSGWTQILSQHLARYLASPG